MSTKKPAKRPRMDVRDDPKSGWERYVEGASQSIDTFYLHTNRDGNPWLLTESSARIDSAEDRARVREEAIVTTMAIPVIIVVGRFPAIDRFAYTPSREEAEQQVDLAFGRWPTRILCSAHATAIETLERRFNRRFTLPVAA